LLGLALVAAAGCGQASSAARCDGSSFDSDAWRRDSQRRADGLTDRQRLADQLVACKTLIGKSRGQVRGLLGRREAINSSRRVWSYVIGPPRGGFNIDHEMFSVYFDERGRVRSVDIWVS
jgi:hypothetical protein